VHDHARPRDIARDLEVTDQLLAFARDLDDLERRVEKPRGASEGDERTLVRPLGRGRDRTRIARDAEIIEREKIEIAHLLPVAAAVLELFRVGVALLAELRPFGGPFVPVDAFQRMGHEHAVVRPDAVERIDLSRAADRLGLHFLKRAGARR
jgi:hypothetical protein